MEKKWNLKQQPDANVVGELASSMGLNPKLAALLVQRGITTTAEARDFFDPRLEKLHNPFGLKDMHKAIDRLCKAIDGGEKILVYGDYDVDGTTAVAIVYQHLKTYVATEKLGFYIPERYKEGYGISEQGVNYAAENGFSLVIALDCGIKAVHRMQYAKQKGVDFIICDHHTPGDELPDAVAVVDSKRADCTYEYHELSGCGVGFKLMQALNMQMGRSADELFEYLDLLAVSIASDIVPMTGENRILAFHGLKKLNENPCHGLKAIIDLADLGGKKISTIDIVFKIGPRINAAGRMSSGSEAVKVLIGEEGEELLRQSEEIDKSNAQRMELDRQTTQEAIDLIKQQPGYDKRYTTVISNADWMKGIVGIVASRLIEEFYRPTIVLTEIDGIASGSARSVEGYDLYSAIDSCSHLLENFGGHMYAAGLSMKVENLPEFKRQFEAYVAKTITPEQREPQIDVDVCLDLKDISMQFFEQLQRFEPFGPCNQKPTFATLNVYDYGKSRVIGKDQSHLKLDLISATDATIQSGVAFGLAQHFDYIQKKHPFHVCYNLELNTFNGRTSIQLMVKDIKY